MTKLAMKKLSWNSKRRMRKLKRRKQLFSNVLWMKSPWKKRHYLLFKLGIIVTQSLRLRTYNWITWMSLLEVGLYWKTLNCVWLMVENMVWLVEMVLVRLALWTHLLVQSLKTCLNICRYCLLSRKWKAVTYHQFNLWLRQILKEVNWLEKNRL